jgi:hypothetical protein
MPADENLGVAQLGLGDDASSAVHMIVPGGGLARDGSRWISCKPNFCLPVRVLSKLFRRLMLTKLAAAHAAGKLQFFGAHAHLADAKAFAALPPLLLRHAGLAQAGIISGFGQAADLRCQHFEVSNLL